MTQNVALLCFWLIARTLKYCPFIYFFFFCNFVLSDFLSWNYPASNPRLVGHINCTTCLAICRPFNCMLSRKADPSNNWLEEVRKNNV